MSGLRDGDTAPRRPLCVTHPTTRGGPRQGGSPDSFS
jgi:hypothetical protein